MIRPESKSFLFLFILWLAIGLAHADGDPHYFLNHSNPAYLQDRQDFQKLSPQQFYPNVNFRKSNPAILGYLEKKLVASSPNNNLREQGADLPTSANLGISNSNLILFRKIEKILSSTDSEVEIGLGNLLIGKVYSPDIEIPKYLAELDNISTNIRSRIGRNRHPVNVIEIMNTYLFGDYGLEAIDAPYAEDFLLHELLESKKGRCMSLVALYMAIAERIDFPISSICLPEHIFVRWLPRKKSRFSFFRRRSNINIETTLKGLPLPDSHYESIAEDSNSRNVNKFYLRTLTKKETLATYLSPLGNALRELGRLDAAIKACRISLSTNPQDAEAWNNLGLVYRRKGHLDMAKLAYQRALDAFPNFAEAWQNLGTLQEDAKKRIEYFKKAISIKPELDIAWRNLVLAYYENRNYQLAWACVNRCRELGHTLPSPLLRELRYKIQSSGR